MVQALSGAALVFRDTLLTSLNHRALSSPQAAALPALDRILLQVERDFDRPAIERVMYPRGERTAALVLLRDKRIVASDPVSGRTLGEITGLGRLPFALFRFHDELMMGPTGHAVLLVEGAGLMFLAISGIFFAHPRRSSAWRVRWRGPPIQQRFDLHRVTGLWLCAFLLLTATTGTLLQYDALRAGTVSTLERSAVGLQDWSQVAARVRDVAREYPAAAIEDVRFSADQTHAKILVYANDAVRPLALDRFTVDISTGRLTQVQRAADEPLQVGLFAWIYPIHSGKAFGAVGAGLLFLVGLGLFVMPILGFRLWRVRLR